MAEATYWAYAMNPVDEGRVARGFVLAVDEKQARAKAKAQIEAERKAFARKYGMSLRVAREAFRSDRYVKVWADPNRETAPNAKHYIEKQAA